MLAKTNKIIQDAAEHLHILTEDEKIRLQCEAREMYEFDIATIRKEGIDEGISQGISQGQQRVNELTTALLNDNRLDDLRRAARDPDYQKRLMNEYRIQ